MLYEFDHQALQNPAAVSRIEPTDEQLMARITARDEAALAALYKRHTPLLTTIVGRVLNQVSDVDDLLQEIFIEIWKQAARFDAEKGKALGWIVTLARRRAIDKVRRKQAYFRAAERLRHESETQTEPALHQGADEDAIVSDRTRIVKQVLATLPEAQREALEFAYFRGMSQREIAAHTGIPLGTIKTRLELAVRKVRKVRNAVMALGGEEEWSFRRA